MRAIPAAGAWFACVFIASACVDLDEPAETTMTEAALTTGPPGSWASIAVPRRSDWRYYDGAADQGTAWRQSTNSWPSGAAPLGYGESYLSTTIGDGGDPGNRNRTAYFVKPFSAGTVNAMFLRVMYDDGFVFYINGREGGRANMPGGTVTFDTLATGHEAANRYVTYDISSQIANLRPSELNYLAIEVHQASASSSDLVLDAELILWHPGPMEMSTSDGISRGAHWHLWDRGGDLGTDWRKPSYDHSGWSLAPGPLGFGEQYVQTDIASGPITTYFRAVFTAEGSVTGLTGEVMYDDGFVAYLNGTEIGRASMPAGPVSATTLATSHEAGATYQRFDWSAVESLLVPGPNVLAVEVHQSSAGSSDLVFDLGLRVKGAWEPQVSGTTASLNGVWFADASRGWVVGDGGTILSTTDGGATWTPQDAGTDQDLVAVELVGASHGWAIGAEGMVLETTDGGATWDGGLITTELTGLSLIDEDRGWISARSDLVYNFHPGSEGLTEFDPKPVGTGSFNDVGFVDAQHGWIVGAVPVDGDNNAAIYYTADGGESWTQQWISGVHHFYLWDVEVIDAKTAWAVGQGSLSGAGEHKLVTRDGGATWTMAPETSNGIAMYAVDFVDAMRGWGVGHSGSIVATDDGGVTWHVQQVMRYAEDPSLSDVRFVDRLNGWAVGDGGTILHTSSGGD